MDEETRLMEEGDIYDALQTVTLIRHDLRPGVEGRAEGRDRDYGVGGCLEGERWENGGEEENKVIREEDEVG